MTGAIRSQRHANIINCCEVLLASMRQEYRHYATVSFESL